MGGGIAMHLALAHPERVARLVLVDAASEDEARRGLRAGRLLRHVLFLLSPLALHAEPLGRSVFRLAVHDPAMLTPEVLEGYTRPLRVRGHLRGLGRQMRDRGREPVLDPGRITQPTLVLWGEHDRVIPLSTGEDLSRRIPGARFELVRGAGHLPLEEQPETCNRILAEFLHTAAAAGASTAGSAVQLEQPA
jgi:pimeloyl-ACP methyl ester carboxylesterase